MPERSSRVVAEMRPRRRSPSTVEVVLAEEHESMRHALRAVLDADPDIRVVAQAAEITRAVMLVHSYRPDVLVMDLRMTSGSTLTAVRQLREDAPDTNVVIIAMGDGHGFVSPARAAGAVGFVLKDRADYDLVEAVRRAAKGEVFTSPRAAASS